MTNIFHVLNGDALAERFPSSISGEIIVFRECLVDGPIKGELSTDFFEMRASYLDQTYSHYIDESYNDFVLPSLISLQEIPKSSKVYLWFDEDVFCQVNSWFICNLLETRLGEFDIFFVIPDVEIEWGFAGLDEHGLILAFENSIQVNGVQLIEIAKLWQAYQQEDIVRMKELANELSAFEWIQTAVDAETDRIVEKTPSQILTSLIEQLGNDNFGIVFQEFNKLAPIYGYGDLMVKRMFDEIVASTNY